MVKHSTAGDGRPARPSIPELLGEFEASLAEKISLPGEAERHWERPPEHIRREVESISKTLRRFALAVAEAMENPRCAHDFLQRLDLRSVSRDHNWRRIFRELTDRDLCFDGHKRALLIRYLQYLSQRKRLLSYIQSQQAGLEETSSNTAVRGADRLAADQGQRVIEAGETAVLSVRPGRSVRLAMGAKVFVIFAGVQGRPMMEGPGMSARELKLGRNLVGRHPECDIVLDPSFRAISRVHALLEWRRDWGDDENLGPIPTDVTERTSDPTPDGVTRAKAVQSFVVHLTDLSTQGTQVLASTPSPQET